MTRQTRHRPVTTHRVRGATMVDATAHRLTRRFRRVNPLMVLMWRLGLGRVVNA